MAARIASGVLVSALLRHVQGQSGFGAVLASGDADAGAILIVLAERGRRTTILERLMQPDGSYKWDSPLQPGHNEEELERFLKKRQGFDPDSWVVELDTASAERLAAEIRSFD